jgi:threonine dehydratase
VPKKNNKEFKDFLKGTGYRYWDESEHPAYQLFLK